MFAGIVRVFVICVNDGVTGGSVVIGCRVLVVFDNINVGM